MARYISILGITVCLTLHHYFNGLDYFMNFYFLRVVDGLRLHQTTLAELIWEADGTPNVNASISMTLTIGARPRCQIGDWIKDYNEKGLHSAL
jgi:hypothetical protein